MLVEVGGGEPESQPKEEAPGRDEPNELGHHPAQLYRVDLRRSSTLLAQYYGMCRYPEKRKQEQEGVDATRGAKKAGLVRHFTQPVFACKPEFRKLDPPSTHGYFGARLREAIVATMNLGESPKVRGGPWVRLAAPPRWPRKERDALACFKVAVQSVHHTHGAFTGLAPGMLPGLNMNHGASYVLEDLNESGLAWRSVYLAIQAHDILMGSLTFTRSARLGGGALYPCPIYQMIIVAVGRFG